MKTQKEVENELNECVKSLFYAETLRAQGTRTLSTMELGILRGKIEAYEMILEIEGGGSLESEHSEEYEDNSD
jgi:hypothetical protein